MRTRETLGFLHWQQNEAKQLTEIQKNIPHSGENKENTAGRNWLWSSRVKPVLLKRKPNNVQREKGADGK